MLTKDDIARAARTADLRADELGLPGWALEKNIELSGLTYVAQQRALRAAMLLDGQDPQALSTTEPTQVKLTPSASDLIPFLAAIYMDGFSAGFTAREATA